MVTFELGFSKPHYLIISGLISCDAVITNHYRRRVRKNDAGRRQSIHLISGAIVLPIRLLVTEQRGGSMGSSVVALMCLSAYAVQWMLHLAGLILGLNPSLNRTHLHFRVGIYK